MTTWKKIEWLAMHIAAAAALFFVLVILMTGTVKAHPSHNSCHKHGAVVHCK